MQKNLAIERKAPYLEVFGSSQIFCNLDPI